MNGSRRTAALIAIAFAVGVVLGVSAMALRTNAPHPPVFHATGTLYSLPPGPVEVIAETVHLRKGFTIRHEHGGPTFNFVLSGRIRITEQDGSARTIGPGGFFFEPAHRPHTIQVLSDLRLDVLRLLPPGAPATTDLPPK